MFKELETIDLNNETLLEHMIKNQKIDVFKTSPELSKLIRVMNEGIVDSPDVFEIIYSFKSDKNSILISLLYDIFLNTQLQHSFLLHCKVVLFDNTGDFNKKTFMKILKIKMNLDEISSSQLWSNLLVFKSYSLTEYVLNLMKVNEMIKYNKAIKAIIVDGSNTFFLEDKGVKNYKDINWGRKTAKKVTPKLPDFISRAYALINKFILKGIAVVDIRLDHFYKENAIRYENGQYFVLENYVKNLFYTNSEIKISSIYLLNRTYNNFVNATMHRNEIEFDIVEVKGVLKFSNCGDRKTMLILYSLDDYRLELRYSEDVSGYKIIQ